MSVFTFVLVVATVSVMYAILVRIGLIGSRRRDRIHDEGRPWRYCILRYQDRFYAYGGDGSFEEQSDDFDQLLKRLVHKMHIETGHRLMMYKPDEDTLLILAP